jgi:serine/threonine protein kinase
MNSTPEPLPRSAAPPSEPGDLPDDPRLMQAVQEYLQQLEAGKRPNRQELLDRYADLAGPLAQCLDGLELVHKAAIREKRSPSGRLGKSGPAAVSAPEGMHTNPLGDFKIVREIGRGGMGIVYEAVQLSLGRRVAVKVLPFAATLDPRHLQRFNHEAQAAAQLHHTNIVPVYYVGCERGVHFYAMQLIEGQALDEVIHQVRRGTGRAQPQSELSGQVVPVEAVPRAEDTTSFVPLMPAGEAKSSPATITPASLALSTHRSNKSEDFFRTAARFVVQAAEALEYAHQFGIVHRDIKPANLLVDMHGRLWITDFGLAHFHADGTLTQTGEIVGTLRYMSPEQASGQRVLLDHRTDVYSLGATLYELATLEPIFSGRTRQELLDQILHTEPRPPRMVDATVPVELETIILKAVSKGPSERYGSAREFAADLERYLEDRPILARRPGLVERSRKWMRRHPAVLRMAVALLVFVAIGSLVTAWLVRTEQEKTRQAYREEQQRAEEAEREFQLARRAVDDMIQLAEEELADHPFLQDLRKRVLESALAYYQELSEQRRDDLGAQLDLAATRNRVNKLLRDLAILQGAGQIALLTHPGVLDDLRPSEPQRSKITELSFRMEKERREAFRLFHRLSSAERRQRFVELALVNEAAMEEILTTEQLRRFRQIVLQLQGAAAFRETDVVKALALTAEQKKQIRAIETEPFSRPPGPPEPRHGDQRKIQVEAREAIDRRIQAVLTAQQAKVWREMIGEPFKGAAPGCLPPGAVHFIQFPPGGPGPRETGKAPPRPPD